MNESAIVIVALAVVVVAIAAKNRKGRMHRGDGRTIGHHRHGDGPAGPDAGDD
ncbi:hypothetical protein M8756_13310 [Lutimaribacter sp. EGI FJ00015]|uniref:Uncharacterized protein n=1 Tax=Lutimaribacter degradans TaxID=2945989 RepID=A0ACC5ZYI1_9RHOB|nr:hypothetical protein [Lutimaribacter sp. EGI FJ00013]MCM2563112.1 hypothetical protein [Lutimaribacter sp. EGI FJ00013]MCO0614291.1 hypothetical protein [Lutimaribacter sp. EGI FJ00015]MCO0637101.1 hypothetical protein [Lutimaribacter sp. EGI FJ00014]